MILKNRENISIIRKSQYEKSQNKFYNITQKSVRQVLLKKVIRKKITKNDETILLQYYCKSHENKEVTNEVMRKNVTKILKEKN